MWRTRATAHFRSLLENPALWDRYQGSLCRELPATAPTAARYSPRAADEYSIQQLLMSAMGIDQLYEHQRQLVDKIEAMAAGGTTIVSLPFGSGRTTSLLLTYMPAVIGRGRNVLILCPDSMLAERQAALWRGALQKNNLGWLTAILQITKDSRDEELERSLHAGTVVVTDYAALHELLLLRSRYLVRLARTQEAIILEDLEKLSGAAAAHARYIIARYRYLSVKNGYKISTIAVLSVVTNAETMLAGLGLAGETVGLVDSAAVSARKLSLWVPAIRDVDAEKLDRDVEFRVTAIREDFWKTAIDLATSSVLAGKITAILSGEFSLTKGDVREVVAGVRADIEKGRTQVSMDVDNMIVLGSDLAEVRRELLERGHDVDDLQTIIFAGYRWPAKAISHELRHVGLGAGLDVLLVAPRTPRYQYYLNRPQDLADFPGAEESAVRPLPILSHFLAAATPECAAFHARAFICEQGSNSDGALIEEFLPRDMIDAIKSHQAGIEGDNGELPDATALMTSALSSLAVLKEDAWTIRDKNANDRRALTYCDEENVHAVYYPGAYFVQDGKRFRVDEVRPHERLALVEVDDRRQVTRRVSAINVVSRVAVGQPVTREGFQFGRWDIEIEEVVSGRRTYQELDFETEGEIEVFGDTQLLRKFRVPCLSISLNGGASLPIVHTLCHLLRTALEIEYGASQMELQVVVHGAEILIFDDLGRSAQLVDSLNTEGAILDALRRCWRILMDCPCQSDEGCPGCLQDWRCTDAEHQLSKWETLELLASILVSEAEVQQRQAAVIQKRCVDDGRFLHGIVNDTVRVLGDKVRAPIKSRYQAAFFDQASLVFYGAPAGICIPGKKKILVMEKMPEDRCQDVVVHEYFHNYQAEGNLSPALRFYNEWKIDDPRNIPFQGKLFSEGSADWGAIIATDYWGSRNRMLEIKKGSSGEYLEGYHVVREIQNHRGVVRTLDFLRNGSGGGLKLETLYDDSGARGAVGNQARGLIENDHIRCLPAGYRDRVDSFVVVSHYLARSQPIAPPEDPNFWTLLRMALSGAFGQLSVEKFVELYGPFGALEIMNTVFSRHYESAGEVPCAGCASRESETVLDACIMHHGKGLLLGLRGIRTRLVAAMLVKWPKGLARGQEDEEE